MKARRWQESKNKWPAASQCYNEGIRSEVLGQVAQLVERSPEKAGVGGSSPSLATTLTFLFSTRTGLLLRLCQMCAVNFPN